MGKLKVLVVGGGIAGVASSIAIARAGHLVTLLEAQNEFTEIGAGIQVPANATRVLAGWGILGAIERRSVQPKRVNYCSHNSNTVLTAVELDDSAVVGDSSPHLLTHRADLLEALVQEARRLNVDMVLGCRVTHIDFSIPSVQAFDGRQFFGDLIIGADGERGFCRNSFVGEPNIPPSIGRLIHRFTICTKKLRQEGSLRHLLELSNITVWLGEDAHAVGYEIYKDGLYNVVISSVCTSPYLYHQASVAADKAEVMAQFEDWNDTFHRLLGLADEVKVWAYTESKPVTNWTHADGKFILIGDAAHAMPPYIAQGAALAIEDAAVLGRLLSKVRNKEQIAPTLRLCHTLRQPRVEDMHLRAGKLGRMYELRGTAAKESRDRQFRESTLSTQSPDWYGNTELRKWLFAYDAEEAAEVYWNEYGFDGDAARNI